jgi:Holliday junction DNA helicase RuvB
VFRLEFYTEEEIRQILERSSQILGVDAHNEGLIEIARRARFTPRTANYLLKRARDYAQVSKAALSKEVVDKTLILLGIDTLGLTGADRAVLTTIIEKFSGGPVGLNTIAASNSEEQSTIEDVHEPYLLQIGLIERTPRGRIVTIRAYEHLGFDIPENHQNRLI